MPSPDERRAKANEARIRAGQRAFRRALAMQSKSTAQRLSAAYDRLLKGLDFKALKALAAVASMTTPELRAAGAFLRLQDQLRNGLVDFTRLLSSESDKMAVNGLLNGRATAIDAVKAVVNMSFNQPSVSMVKQMVNYVDSQAFRDKLAAYPHYHAQAIGDIALADASLGKSPMTTAQHIVGYLDTFPRVDAIRMARTLQLYSARAASSVIYSQNNDIVSGWYWSCSQDADTCASCWAMQGSIHDVDEILDDHYSGRCAMIPITRDIAGFGTLDMPPPQTGEDIFSDLPEETQIEILGPAKYAAYVDGLFTFDQLSTITTNDPLYGSMRGETTLTQLIGAEAAKAYMRKRAA